MWRTRIRTVALTLWLPLVASSVASTQQPAPPGPGNSAESLRQFLSDRGALSASWWNFSTDLRQLYSERSISKPPGCPLNQFLDQPATASDTAVNVFVVNFPSDPESFCRTAPNPRSCQAISSSCVTVNTSVFCDFSYLDRRETIAALAYHSAWKGLSGVQDGEAATFSPLPHDALIDLARSTAAATGRTVPPPDLPVTADAKRLADNAESTVHELATSVSLLAPVLHEIGHIEQSYCGRGLVPNASDEDFVARMMLTRGVDWETQTRLYERLTCSTLPRNELAADLRSVDMLLRYLEEEAPKAAAAPRFDFSGQVDLVTRRQLRGLARWSREIAMLSLAYGLEYDVLIYQDPAWGLSMANGEPNTQSLSDYTTYYLNAGGDRNIRRVRGHLEPAFRATMLASYLDFQRLGLVNLGRSTAASHLRTGPFLIGRMGALNQRDCAAPVGVAFDSALADYVLGSFQGTTRSRTTKLTGPGSLAEANQLLARFLASGADYRALTGSLRPQLADLRAIFEQPFADRAFRHYQQWNVDDAIQPNPGQTEVIVRADASDRVRQSGGSSSLPGGYEGIAKQLRPGLTIYSWKFLKPGSHFGLAFDGLYYVNGHWVLAPKPYRIE